MAHDDDSELPDDFDDLDEAKRRFGIQGDPSVARGPLVAGGGGEAEGSGLREDVEE